jgi:hypothetical protein
VFADFGGRSPRKSPALGFSLPANPVGAPKASTEPKVQGVVVDLRLEAVPFEESQATKILLGNFRRQQKLGMVSSNRDGTITFKRHIEAVLSIYCESSGKGLSSNELLDFSFIAGSRDA